MIKSDNIKIIENKIIDLALKSLKLNHEYYNTYDKILNMYIEFYIYAHYYIENIYLVREDNKIVNRLNKIFDNYQINKNKDFNYIKYTLNDIIKNTNVHRVNISYESKVKYKSMGISLTRKLKIAKLLIKDVK